ncbi:MAG: DegT/DnrJ/EryC1/StrS aminotransferase family protein [Eubacterium sp.]|nr:DegT/DnrJ/EryC1/StrS aminotransferase family protein [Eubacterium sp.]
MNRQISFSPPDISEEEIQAVVEVLKSSWITTGPKTKEFEKSIASYCGTPMAVCMNSATAAMELTYRLFDIGEGDEVITTPYTYTATASAILHTGAKPVLVDVEKNGYEMDCDMLEAVINKRTKAIVPVDIGGRPCNYDRIRKIIEKKKDLFQPADNEYQKALGRILIMADSAHGFGAKRDGKMTGQMADFTTFSFHAVKNLTTAEGGAVTWQEIPGIRSEDIYRDYMLLSLHGQSKDALAKNKAGAWEYDIVTPAYKCNMTDIMAALGLAQFKRYPEFLKRRKEIVSRYDQGLAKINQGLEGYKLTSLIHYQDQVESSGHLYLMRVKGADLHQRNLIIEKMAEKGVATNVHYKPLPLLTAYKNLGYEMRNYPRAYDMFYNEITLPLHTKLSDEDVDYVMNSLEEVLHEILG